jgi:hypothetical protein
MRLGTANSASGDDPSLTVDLLAEALEKHPDPRDAVVLALQQLGLRPEVRWRRPLRLLILRLRSANRTPETTAI